LPHALKHPARLVPLAFLVAIVLGTALLMLPHARTGDDAVPFIVALFTATSAICVTGLVVTDTATYWSGFGQAIILALIQVGGFGIMSGATLLGLLVSRRLRLSTRLLAQAETRGLALGDIVDVLRLVLVVTIVVQSLLALWLVLALRFGHAEPWARALWKGVFHAVSAFNNAGFSTYPEGAARFATDALVLTPIMLGVVIGGIGMPVLHDLRKDVRHPARWSLHTKMTLLGTTVLLVLGFAATLAFEWTNPATLGAFDPATRLLHALFHSVMTRSGGFSAVPTDDLHDETIMVSYGLMLVGGGSAGTAGGIKVATFVVLLLIVWAEIRSERDAVAFHRRVSADVQRLAVTVALMAASMVGLGTLVLLSLTDLPLRDVLFEVISAFATVGLSTGITPDLPPAAQTVLVALMFMGRVGPVALATALALRSRTNPYRYPEERPIVG